MCDNFSAYRFFEEKSGQSLIVLPYMVIIYINFGSDVNINLYIRDIN